MKTYDLSGVSHKNPENLQNPVTAVSTVGKESVVDKNGAVTDKKTDLGFVVMEGPMSEVSVEMSYTKNLGNYQSARVQVSLKVPANLTQDSIEAAFLFAKDWVDGRLTTMVEELDGA